MSAQQRIPDHLQRLRLLSVPVSAPRELTFLLGCWVEARSCTPHSGQRRSSRGAWRTLEAGVRALPSPRQAAAFSPISLLLLLPQPHLGPGQQQLGRTQKPWSIVSLLQRVVLVGGRCAGIRGRPITWHIFIRISFQYLFKVHLEARLRAWWAWAEVNVSGQPRPLSSSESVRVPHLMRALLFSRLQQSRPDHEGNSPLPREAHQMISPTYTLVHLQAHSMHLPVSPCLTPLLATNASGTCLVQSPACSPSNCPYHLPCVCKPVECVCGYVLRCLRQTWSRDFTKLRAPLSSTSLPDIQTRISCRSQFGPFVLVSLGIQVGRRRGPLSHPRPFHFLCPGTSRISSQGHGRALDAGVTKHTPLVSLTLSRAQSKSSPLPGPTALPHPSQEGQWVP